MGGQAPLSSSKLQPTRHTPILSFSNGRRIESLVCRAIAITIKKRIQALLEMQELFLLSRTLSYLSEIFTIPLTEQSHIVVEKRVFDTFDGSSGILFSFLGAFMSQKRFRESYATHCTSIFRHVGARPSSARTFLVASFLLGMAQTVLPSEFAYAGELPQLQGKMTLTQTAREKWIAEYEFAEPIDRLDV